MSEKQPRPLGAYLAEEVSALRVERQWLGVREKMGKRSVGLRLPLLLAALVSMATLLVVVLRWPTEGSEPTLRKPPALASSEDSAPRLEHVLPDGSRFALRDGSDLRTLPSDPDVVRVALSEGQATFDVAPNSQRQFRVEAGQVAVVVVGTRFTVQRSGGEVSVFVERGRVRIERKGGVVATLGPSQRWSGREQPSEHSVEDRDIQPSPPPEGSERQSEAEVSGTKAERGRALFEAAREARRDGDIDRASRLFVELLERHPGDPRAALAAFELGRLRMDFLGDSAGAMTALERAITLRPGAGFHEDALARIVTACDRIGCSSCARARQRYLASYPGGVHAKEVAERCKGR